MQRKKKQESRKKKTDILTPKATPSADFFAKHTSPSLIS